MSAHPILAGRLYWVKTPAWEGPVVAGNGADAIASVIERVLS